MNRTRLLSIVFGSALVVGGYAFAQPKENISKARHPNLAAAQRFVDQAFQKIVAAQEANEFDLGGHAAKAKALLDEASRELKQAAETANRNNKGKKGK